MREKRARQRRNYAATLGFPIMDTSGCIVPFDRSRTPDRRLNNLRLVETDVTEIQLLRMNS